MRIIKVKNYDEVSVKTANMILGQVNLKPDAVLGLATGGSPVGAYKKIVEAYNNGEVDFSGIAPALMTALALNVPMIILKKQPSKVLNDNLYQTVVTSFTKGTSYELTLYQDYIDPSDKVLLIDDFLANGEAAMGASRLIKESGAELSGIGILIEKSFQKGRKRLEDAGYYVYSQARIGRLDKGVIEFLPEDAPVLEGVDEKELLDK